MQRTRLATLVDTLANQFGRWVFNPWRRLSLVIIGLLFGNFFGIAIASIAGQTADLDVVVSAFLLAAVEITSWIVYRRPRPKEGQSSLLLEVLNAFKIGITYALFVEAFKLGS
ncbi:DUF565 domain-containing protein [Leptolyngbya sp. PCC 6406]|uniref:DUF565 domain-containing protein n=1 Tax=Leptolyngbya sp. PCC 6406 TaxID=1173264 RepID=UPI0002AC81A4|nr:DUF565 domain-containing protein [Leptolyngbya sp. PCC 6406]